MKLYTAHDSLLMHVKDFRLTKISRTSLLLFRLIISASSGCCSLAQAFYGTVFIGNENVMNVIFTSV